MKEILFGLICLVVCHEAARIFIAAQIGSKSHHNMFIPIINQLTSRGHWVTFITNYHCNELKNNGHTKVIVIEKLGTGFGDLFNNFQTLTGHMSKRKTEWLIDSKTILSMALLTVTETLDHPQVQDVLQNDTYDLVIMSQTIGYVGYSLACHYKVPFILIAVNDMFPGMATLLGDSEHTEYVPFSFSSFSDDMNLMERTVNTLITLYFTWIGKKSATPTQQEIGKYLPHCSETAEVAKNVSLFLSNSHPTFKYPRVLPPDVIEIGAVHCRPAKPLPAPLETFAASAHSGFIVFAIGTNNLMSDMPEDIMTSFLKTFSRLPQRIVWQWKGSKRSNLPGNVLTVDWLPQQDLLGHPNCRLFLTHGGIASLQEAIYHGVPVLGLPFGRDQHRNLKLAVHHGYALQLEWGDVNLESLNTTIHHLLHDPKFMENAKRMSSLLHDQLETPLERAVYWIEYVLRHNGARHLRLASRDLAPYQRALIDVYAIGITVILLPILLLVCCVRKCCCNKKS